MSIPISRFFPRGLVPVSSVFMGESTVLNYDSDLLALIVLVGAGGGGGCAVPGSTTNHKMYGQGGNAGSTAIQLLRLRSGIDYDFQLAGPTAAVGQESGITTRTAWTGNTGGDAELYIDGEVTPSYAAFGGKGGTAACYYRSHVTNWLIWPNGALDPPPYGIGAETIFRGGLGGIISSTNELNANTQTRSIASGGGAVNILGVPAGRIIGGSAQVATTPNNEAGKVAIASGGAGVAGTGGFIMIEKTYSDSLAWCAASGGGGSGGDAPRVLLPEAHTYTPTTWASNHDGPGGEGFPFDVNTMLSPNGVGEDGMLWSGGGSGVPSPQTSGPGAGGRGTAVWSGSGGSTPGSHGGIFGGGGGCVSGDGSANGCIGGDGGYGAGGGGSCSDPVGQDDGGWGGMGGAACAFVFLFSDFGKIKV